MVTLLASPLAVGARWRGTWKVCTVTLFTSSTLAPKDPPLAWSYLPTMLFFVFLKLRNAERKLEGRNSQFHQDSSIWCGGLYRFRPVPHSQVEEPTKPTKEETLHIHQEHDRQRRRRRHMNCRVEIDDQVFSHPKTTD